MMEARRPGLSGLRLLFGQLFLAGLAILVVISRIVPVGRPSGWLRFAVPVLGVYGIGAALWSQRRSLSTESSEALAASFRSNFFVGFALNEGPLLLAFVFSFVENQYWPYLFALPFWAIGMWTLYPSNAVLERRQQEITAAGSTLDLRSSLDAPASIS